MVVAGEFSGDNHAFALLSELQKTYSVELFGTGGPRLASLGQKQLATVQEMAVIGFVGAIKKIPFLMKLAKNIGKTIESEKPDAILLVDYTGYNLRLAKKLAKYNIPIIQFVSPQFWIWQYSRVYTLRDYVDLVLCILPFEEAQLRNEGVNAVYIGNPVVEHLSTKYENKESFKNHYNIADDELIIGLVPGSRPKEIKILMPVFAKALEVFGSQHKCKFILAKADNISENDIKCWLEKAHNVEIVSGITPDVMKYSDLLWICSGTATLEAAILGTPMIIMYDAPAVDVFLIKLMTNLRMIGMPNIISGKYIVPELLKEECNPESLVKKADEMIAKLDSYRLSLKPISKMFTGKTPIKTAANEIIKLIKSAKAE